MWFQHQDCIYSQLRPVFTMCLKICYTLAFNSVFIFRRMLGWSWTSSSCAFLNHIRKISVTLRFCHHVQRPTLVSICIHALLDLLQGSISLVDDWQVIVYFPRDNLLKTSLDVLPSCSNYTSYLCALLIRFILLIMSQLTDWRGSISVCQLSGSPVLQTLLLLVIHSGVYSTVRLIGSYHKHLIAFVAAKCGPTSYYV